MSKFEYLNVPSQCLNCPNLSLIEDEVRELEQRKEQATALGEDMMVAGDNAIIIPLGSSNNIDELNDEETPAIMDRMKRSIASDLDYTDKQLKACEQLAEATYRSCWGALGMRAVKAGVEYTVYVCTSARTTQLNGEDNQRIPAYLKARTKSD